MLAPFGHLGGFICRPTIHLHLSFALPLRDLSSQWLKSALDEHGPIRELWCSLMPMVLAPFDHLGSFHCRPIRHLPPCQHGLYRANGSNLLLMSMGQFESFGIVSCQ
jgi:hypothetical protein